MAILNPEHLLAQADRLIEPPPAGPPRQVDIRRAISAAYYAVFHTALIAAADRFVGYVHRATREYGLVFRSIDHRTLKVICEEIVKPTPPRNYVSYVPVGGFGPEIIDFADAFPDLQEMRHSADYDPLVRFRTADAKSVIATARASIGRFGAAPLASRKAFLYLLIFPPKR